MNQRLGHVVAGYPSKMILGAALPLKFRQSGWAFGHPVRGPKEVLLDADDFSDRAVANALNGFLVPGVVTAVQARKDAKP